MKKLKKYTLKWAEEAFYEVDVFTTSKKEAENKFKNGDYDSERIRESGGNMIENSLEIGEDEAE